MSPPGRLQPLPIVRKTPVNLVIQDNLDLGSKAVRKLIKKIYIRLLIGP
jgi:hypothetical protein